MRQLSRFSRKIAALALALMLGTSCHRSTPAVVQGREQQPYEDPGAPLALLQVSHIGSQPVQAGSPLRTENRTLVEGQVERFPAGGILYMTIRIPGKKWHVIPVPADVSPAGEWKVAAELIAGGDAYETKAELKAIITREPPHVLDLVDAELRAISYQSSAPVRLIIMPEGERHGAVSLMLDAIQGQSPQAERAVFAPMVFGASGTVHDLPPSATVWVAAQCGQGEWRVIATAWGRGQAWSIENAAWPYRGRASSVTCRVMGLVHRGEAPAKEVPFAVLEKGALAMAGPYPAIITPARLEISTITGEDGRERRVADELEQGPVVANTSARLQVQVVGSGARAQDRVYLTLQPSSSVRTLMFGPGRRVDDGLWVFDRVPMVFPGYGNAKTVLVGATFSDTPLEGRALTQPELAETGLGYSPLIQVAAPPAPGHAANAYVVTSVGGMLQGSGPAVLRLDTLSPEVEGEWSAGGEIPPVVGLCSDDGLWHFQRAGRSSASTWQAVLKARESERGGANGQLTVVDGTDDLTSVESVDGEWLRAFGFGSPVTIPVHLPRKPWITRFWHWTTRITEPTGGIDMTGILMQMLNIALVLAVLAGLLWLMPRWLSRCGDWWQAFRDAGKNQPVLESPGPAEERIFERYARRIAKVLGRYGSRIAAVRAVVESIERRLKAEREELAQKQREAGHQSPDTHLSPRAKLALTGTMILGENAFNLTAFDVFGQPFLETVIMAVSVGIAVPISAQLVGVWLRQFPKPAWRTALQMAAVLSLIVWVLSGLNSVRIMVLQGKDPEFLMRHPNLGAAIFPVNVAVLLASAIAVYMSLDAIPGFVEVHKRVQKLEGRLAHFTKKLRKLESRQKSRNEYWEAGRKEALAYYRMINDRHRTKPRTESPVTARPTAPEPGSNVSGRSKEDHEIQPVGVATEFESKNGTGAKHGH